MKSLYFVDAWFFIAGINRFDSHHRAVLRLRAQLKPSSFVTHDGVLTEVLAYFSGHERGFRTVAAAVVRTALRDFETVAAADRVLFEAGLSLYERRPDKQYSLVDCMSMELMKQRGITHILTNDHHFRQEGFNVVSDAP